MAFMRLRKAMQSWLRLYRPASTKLCAESEGLLPGNFRKQNVNLQLWKDFWPSLAQRVGSRSLRSLDTISGFFLKNPSSLFVWCYGSDFAGKAMEPAMSFVQSTQQPVALVPCLRSETSTDRPVRNSSRAETASPGCSRISIPQQRCSSNIQAVTNI